MFVFNITELNARLKRMASPSLFGDDVQELSLHAVMQSNNRLRFKVHTIKQNTSTTVTSNTKCELAMRPHSCCLCGLFPLRQIYDANSERFEVPHEHVEKLPKSNPSIPISNTLEITQRPFGLTVRRQENKQVL